MNKITKSILATLGGINFLFKIFSPLLLVLTIIKVFNLIGFQKYLLLTIAFLTIIYEITKVAGLDVLINIINNAIHNDRTNK